MSKQKQIQKHLPVMVGTVLDCLEPKPGQSYLDLTAGYGGHAKTVLEITRDPQKAVLVDRDARAVGALRERLVTKNILHCDFLSALRELSAEGKRFNMVLADLGVSSPQLDESDRGFSFQSDPLDMRMDQQQDLSALKIVNGYSESQLVQILSEFGEEPKAREIANKIVRSRPIKSAQQLTGIAKSAWPGHSKVHPATRTFQAIRIAVNDELNQSSCFRL